MMTNNSLLDNDLYKLTMMQVVWNKFPHTYIKYKFKCRNEGIQFTKNEIKEIRECLEGWNDYFSESEILWLKTLGYFRDDFLDFLRVFRQKSNFIHIVENNKQLQITIEGPWIDTILLEVPVLSIVNEVYFKKYIKKCSDEKKIMKQMKDNLEMKMDYLESHNDPTFKFSDFGTRRRFSQEIQDFIIFSLLGQNKNFIGTSNMWFAKKYNIPCIGTMAHEWIMAGQGMNVSLKDSQKYMLQKWADFYRGKLGIALSDTLGFDAFLKDFDGYFARLYDGCRQDSGDPAIWVLKLINHYRDLGIDSRTKKAVFSDGLTIPAAYGLHTFINGRIQDVYGIGTDLTNDVGLEPLQIVIKMTECNHQPVAKLSDTKGKLMCHDEVYLKYLKNVFNIA
jgi:nicotinate phosphoribosyltransferase